MSADDLAKWQAAVARHKRQQRARRWKRKAPAIGPGMLRRRGEVDGDHDDGDHPGDHPGPPDAA